MGFECMAIKGRLYCMMIDVCKLSYYFTPPKKFLYKVIFPCVFLFFSCISAPKEHLQINGPLYIGNGGEGLRFAILQPKGVNITANTVKDVVFKNVKIENITDIFSIRLSSHSIYQKDR